MPDLGQFHREIVFIHLLGVFLFLLAHGVSAGVLFRVRSERDPVALRALLALSESSLMAMGVGALIFFVSGVLAGFSGNYWTSGPLWIWVSLALVIVAFLAMTPMARVPLNRVREAVGDPAASGDTAAGAEAGSAAPPDPAALEAAVNSVRPMLVAALGLGTVGVLAWLMMFKPF